jgi:hypothetical protein
MSRVQGYTVGVRVALATEKGYAAIATGARAVSTSPAKKMVTLSASPGCRTAAPYRLRHECHPLPRNRRLWRIFLVPGGLPGGQGRLATGRLRPSAPITFRFPLSEIGAALERVKVGQALRAVLFHSKYNRNLAG